jgi:hypothetical protein
VAALVGDDLVREGHGLALGVGHLIELLDGLLSRPSSVTVALLRIDPAMDQLRDDRRFQELLQKYGGST